MKRRRRRRKRRRREMGRGRSRRRRRRRRRSECIEQGVLTTGNMMREWMVVMGGGSKAR